MLNINTLPPPPESKPAVSVIIAVYGAELWIERCARSLFEQTLDSIEYIFVDDCSPDASIAVLQRVLADYPNRQPQVRIIRHETNQGVAVARTTGMKAATGLYMIHCDPDDWVEPEAYQLMFEKAIATDADIVTCGIITIQKEHIDIYNPNYSGIGIEALNSGKYTYSLCNLLVKSNIVFDNTIFPFSGLTWGEDTSVIFRLYYYATKVKTLNWALYHYDQTINKSSATKQNKLNHYINELTPLFIQLSHWFSERGCSNMEFLTKEKINLKIAILSCGDIKNWINTFPECNNRLHEFTKLTAFQRLILPFAIHNYTLSKIYYLYGKIRCLLIH